MTGIRRHALGALAAALAAALLLGCQAPGIHHTVFFTLKHAPGSPGERAFFERLDSLAAIPGVEDFARVREVSDANPYEHGLMMRFADRAAYERYDAHPDHRRFVQEVWVPGVASFQEIDFVPAASERGTARE